tara:strand:+ start:856 stop:2313 length:1458 start_codon:yes stop_codon:yes gene_type:complete
MGRHFSTSANYKKLFHLKNDFFLLHEYNKSITLNACPSELKPYLVNQRPVVHTSFKGFGNKKGYITSYLLKGNQLEIGKATINSGKQPEMNFPNKDRFIGEDIDKKLNIFYRHSNLESLHPLIINAIRSNVNKFCNGRSAVKTTKGDHFTLVDKIEPNPRFSLINPGEGRKIIKFGKGMFYDFCLLQIGLDFSMGCISNVTSEGMYAPQEKCSYCYEWQNGPCTLDTFFDINEDWMIEKLKNKVEEMELSDRSKLFFRIGQGTETMTPQYMQKWEGFQDNLKISLRSLIRLKEESGIEIKVAMPTKIAEFDEELVELFKGANVALMGSVGYSELESGIIAHGFGVEQRLEGIREYKKAGVNANIYIATDITQSLDKVQEDARFAIDFGGKNKIPIQFLDIRVTKKKDVKIILNKSWTEALTDKNQTNLFNNNSGGLKLTGQGYLHANTTHPDFLEIIKNNRGDHRLCSTHAKREEQKCGLCFMDK